MATMPKAVAARPGGFAGLSRSRMIMLGGGMLGLLGIGLLGASISGVWNRMFGTGVSDAEVYEVKPVELEVTLEETGELKARENVEIKSEVEGESVIRTIVAESTKVKKGDLVVELASDALVERMESEDIELRKITADFEAARQDLEITRNENLSKKRKCEIDLEVAELELKQYLEGDYLKLLQSAEIDIEQTKQEIERKEEEIRKNEPLREKGFVTALKLKELNFELYKLRKTLEKNELTKRILLEYDRPKAEKQKRSAVDQAREELEREAKRATSREVQAAANVEERQAQLRVRETRRERLQRAVEKCKIYAPSDGVVQYPSNDGWGMRSGSSGLTAGEKVFEGQTLLILPDVSQMLVSARIHEADRHKVREAMTCLIKVPAVPNRSFHGKIVKIAQFADSAHRWLNPELKEHTTEILLDETDAPVSPGDTANITILVDKAPEVLTVPVQSVYSRGPHNYVFVDRDGRFMPVEIQIGRSSVQMVEVTEGVKAGDRVLQRADESLLAQLPNAGIERESAAAPPAGGQKRGGGPAKRGGGGRG